MTATRVDPGMQSTVFARYEQPRLHAVDPMHASLPGSRALMLMENIHFGLRASCFVSETLLRR